MMFTPKNQLANMIAGTASQVQCGQDLESNLPRLIGLQAQYEAQEMYEDQQNDMYLDLDTWY